MAGTPGKNIVDTHHHLCSAAYVDFVKQKTGLPAYVEQILRNGSPAKSLEDMDRAGIARSSPR